MSRPFGFTDVVGQDEAKLALLLGAVDPLLGGVLLRGEKGSAKTTLARGLADLLGGVPFVELPLAATEDRVVGSIDVAAALGGGEVRFQPGLLASADGGVLYVDEINLLADHLVDVLLDVAGSGVNRVERDGVSHHHRARFVLVGSMNPEEGELRPQLLDRFGLCVEVTAPTAVGDRVEAVRRRLGHDGACVEQEPPARPSTVDGADMAHEVRAARPARLPLGVLQMASRLALEVGAEGLRADLALCRAAAAAAGLDRRDEATVDDLRRVAPLVLTHRARRRPFDPPRLPPEALADALERAVGPQPDATGPDVDPDGRADGGSGTDGARPDGGDHGTEPATAAALTVGPARRPPLPAPSTRASARGRAVGSVPAGEGTAGSTIAIVPTARGIAARRAGGGAAAAAPSDLRVAVRAERARRLVVLCVDLSGSMGADERARAATGTAIGLLDDAYQRRHRVAVVGFRGEGAELLLSPTTSVEVARNRLCELRTGGRTPLAGGLRLALDVATARNPATGAGGDEPLLVVLTDGRATGDGDPLGDALDVAAEVRRRGVTSVVIDCEPPDRPLGLALKLAQALGGSHVAASSLVPSDITEAVRSLVG